MAEETGGTGQGHRAVTLTRVSKGVFDVANERGGTMRIGGGGEDFSPVELLLAAIAGCTAIDVDYITTKRVQPETFTVDASGEKLRDDSDGLHFQVGNPESRAEARVRALREPQLRERLRGGIRPPPTTAEAARAHTALVERRLERGRPLPRVREA